MLVALSGGLALLELELGPSLSPEHLTELQAAVVGLDNGLQDANESLRTWATDLKGGKATSDVVKDLDWPDIVVPADANKFKQPGASRLVPLGHLKAAGSALNLPAMHACPRGAAGVAGSCQLPKLTASAGDKEEHVARRILDRHMDGAARRAGGHVRQRGGIGAGRRDPEGVHDAARAGLRHPHDRRRQLCQGLPLPTLSNLPAVARIAQHGLQVWQRELHTLSMMMVHALERQRQGQGDAFISSENTFWLRAHGSDVLLSCADLCIYK